MDDKIFMQCLEIISWYNMTPEEATAFKLSCIYREIAKKVFPEYRHPRLGKGDPRKTSLFKYCHKLIQDTKGQLQPKEYSLYIKAQLEIFKGIGKINGEIPLVQPSCIVGPKAWKRWLLWKKYYELKKNRFQSADKIIEAHKPEYVKKQLEKTKVFLNKRTGDINQEKINQLLDDGRLVLWVKTQQVSPYYAILSKTIDHWLQKNNKSFDIFEVDINYYRPGVTENIREFFVKLFEFEDF